MSEINFIMNAAKFSVGLVVHYLVASLFLCLNAISFVLNQYQLYFGAKATVNVEKVSHAVSLHNLTFCVVLCA